MRTLTESDKQQIWAEVREEFPDDVTMQQVHYVRLMHFRQTEGMSPSQRVRFFQRPKRKAGSRRS